MKSEYTFITLRDRPELMDRAAAWFHEKWRVPTEAYRECMTAYLNRETEYGWYLCLDGDRIIGGMGVIENDFHDRKDLTPNVCAVYTEEAFRGQGIAGRLLNIKENGINMRMKELVLYIHGKGGCAGESEHYKPLFPECEVIGLDYQTSTPGETGEEIWEAVTKLNAEYDSIDLIANSIGAFFSMNAGIDEMIHRAYFISPVVDMEKLILNMMSWANVTEKELEEKGVIPTSFGEDLSWEYLCYVREHPASWTVPTRILYGSRDNLTSHETITAFAKAHGAELTVMDGGEHWFHTDEQMQFLDNWIIKGRSIR